MITCEVIGQFTAAKNEPCIKAEKDMKNHQFIVDNGNLYLIDNTINGDDSYREGVVIKAGKFLNGFLVKAWEGQKLVIDEKHIDYADGQDYNAIGVGATLLEVNDEGNLKIVDAAPAEGVYFAVTDKTTLTGKAVKARVMVA